MIASCVEYCLWCATDLCLDPSNDGLLLLQEGENSVALLPDLEDLLCEGAQEFCLPPSMPSVKEPHFKDTDDKW